MWKIYDTLLENLPQNIRITDFASGDIWTMAETESGGLGLAMTTSGTTIPAELESLEGLPSRVACARVKSWNHMEASQAMAAINACYNTESRLGQLGCYEPFEKYCTEGLDFTGKTVGVIGHMNMPDALLKLTKDVFILERHPKPGDYPDSACEYLLPKCDIVLITGSSFVNKTMPRLLQLSSGAYTVVTGPTVPMCPELLNLGIDRLAGLVITDRNDIRTHVTESRSGPPYRFGRPFLLRGDRG